MNCMKCGRDTTGEHVFCDRCQSVMDRYPVKPGTAVHLPKRDDTPRKPAPRKRTVPPEEQIQNLRRMLRRSRLFGIILLVALTLAALLLLREFAGDETPIIGQNYTIDINLMRK